MSRLHFSKLWNGWNRKTHGISRTVIINPGKSHYIMSSMLSYLLEQVTYTERNASAQEYMKLKLYVNGCRSTSHSTRNETLVHKNKSGENSGRLPAEIRRPATFPAEFRRPTIFRRIFRRPFFGQEYTFSTISDVPDRVVRCLDRDLRSISANFQEILFSGEIPTSDMVLARFQPSVFDENYIFGLLVTRRVHTKHFRLG
uniref:Uncharacterized protein n=1 Tax=Helianthus annuus TaxID=4232 RepID=A0A251TP08_HELAN